MRRVTALPLSFVAHAVALATAVMLSVMPADLPAARAETRPPIQFEVPRVTVVAVAPSASAQPSRPLPARPAAPITAAPPTLPVAPVMPVTVDPLIVGPGAEQPPIGEPPGTCVGCVIGSEASRRGDRGSGNGQSSDPVEPYRIGGSIREPRKLKHVVPVYPEMARVTHVGGNVTIECTVTPEGNVADVRVVSGHPLLTEAAARAVEQWQFTPTLLNGVPVPVILTVTVKFQLR